MPRISDAKRAAIADDIRAGGTCRGIATKHSVSADSVRRIAAAENIPDPFVRTATESATRARVADLAAMRAQLAADLLADTQRLRQRAWESYQIVQNTKDGPVVVDLERPPLRDVQAAYTSIAIAADKSAMLVRQDSDGGVEHARGVIGALADALRTTAENLPGEPAS